MSAPALILEKPKRYRLTDFGNAERFVDRHGQDVRWVPAWRQWLLWDGKRWKQDDTHEVERLVKDTVRSMWDEVKELDGSKKADLIKHIMSSEKNSRVNAMIERIRAERINDQHTMALRPSQLDANPWLIACENGTIDLRTAELREHRREDFITRIVPASFDPDARCDRWEQFLKTVLAGDQELIDFMQRAVGYSLTGSTGERALFFLYGHGRNGKSKFLETLRALLAGYANQADFTTFLERKGDGPRNDIARLTGARVVTSSEVGEGKRLNESLVKTLTGDETITARFLHAEFFEFKPEFKLWLAANHRPVIRGTDNAIWDRVKLIPFTVRISDEDRDDELLSKLVAELNGILTWAVAGAVLWHQHGLGSPKAVQDATDQYRRDSDVLGAFLDDCCDLDPAYEIGATELYTGYRRWAEASGEYLHSLKTFGNQLEERGFPWRKSGIKYRIGLRLRDDVQKRFPPRRSDALAAQPDQGALSV